MGLKRIWDSSGKFRLGMSITLVLIILGAFHKVLIRLFLGDIDPLAVGSFTIFEDPSRDHLLGTDRYGRDVLGLVLGGLPLSLVVAAIAGLIATVVGATIGFISGYKGGKIDAFLRTVTDMFLVIPTLPLILVLGAYSRDISIAELAVVLSIFSWPFAARVVRSQALSLRERPYVELSKMTNMKDREIIFQDILPNMLPYLGIGFATSSVGAAFALVGLTLLGLGPSGSLDLGTLISLALEWGVLSLGKWPIFVAPVTLLVLLFVGLALITQGLEEFQNPRLKGVAS